MVSKAEKHLLKDKVFKDLVKNLDPLDLPQSGNVFNELVKNIVYQQISYKAADNIYARFLILIKKKKYKPKDVIALSHDELRSVGLSNQKAIYVKNISEYFIEKRLLRRNWDKFEDQEIIKILSDIKGVGVWTVQMILLFELQRPDVFPYGDLAIQQSIKELYNLDGEKKELIKQMNKVADNWKPYRSMATLYLWSWKREQSKK